MVWWLQGKTSDVSTRYCRTSLGSHIRSGQNWWLNCKTCWENISPYGSVFKCRLMQTTHFGTFINACHNKCSRVRTTILSRTTSNVQLNFLDSLFNSSICCPIKHLPHWRVLNFSLTTHTRVFLNNSTGNRNVSSTMDIKEKVSSLLKFKRQWRQGHGIR